jgi:transposase-like protein
MNTPVLTGRYKHHRCPAEIISRGVWLYYRFSLSYRDVEELWFARRIIVPYEALRKWGLKFGQQYANQLRCRHPQCLIMPHSIGFSGKPMGLEC